MEEPSDIGLALSRQPDETWYEACKRLAQKAGLEDEVMSVYERCLAAGQDPANAAWCALYEWDCLEPI